MVEYIKGKLTGALIVAFYFYQHAMVGVEVVTDKDAEIIAI